MPRPAFFLSASVLVAVVALDQLAKAAVRSLLAVGESIDVFGPVRIIHVANTGSVFGLGQGHVLVPTIASIVILVALPVALRRARALYGYLPSAPEAFCLALIAGGAIGNLIDRVRFSGVTDFIDVELFPGFHWPAFNLADSCIVVGTLALLLFLHRRGVFNATVDSAG